jgi:hypothetical protein
MQAPVVDVVFEKTPFVSRERWVQLFRDAIEEGRKSQEVGFVFRAYNLSRQANGTLRFVPAWGGCPMWQRHDSNVYRGLYGVLVKVGFMCIVKDHMAEQSDGMIRFVPRQLYREPVREEAVEEEVEGEGLSEETRRLSVGHD